VAITLGNVTSSVPVEPVKGSFEVVSAVPNPATGFVTLQYHLAEAGPVSIQILAVDGREVTAPVVSRTMEPGDHSQVVDLRSLPAGNYSARIATSASVMIERFVVVR
jgi:hypothetical protein